MVHPLYSYGKDGYVFGRSQLTPLEVPDEYLESFSSYVAEMQKYCESRGREFLFVINPNKAAVYSDYLPDGMHANHSVTVPLDPLLEKKKVSFLDLTDAMIDARARGEVPYNRMFDANHWNFVGAFHGVNAMRMCLRSRSRSPRRERQKPIFRVMGSGYRKATISSGRRRTPSGPTARMFWSFAEATSPTPGRCSKTSSLPPP